MIPRTLPSHALRVGRASAVVALGLLGTACTPPPVPEFPSFEVRLPDPETVDEVLFLVGDAGAAIEGRSPILVDLERRVENWSAAVARDSSVSVVFLGDLVYPVGVRDRDHPAFEQDSTHLWAQIGLLDGPEARRRASLGIFVAGNHDWGNMRGDRGVARLRNLEEQLEIARRDGIRVELLPEAGSPGPEVVDLRNNTRIVAIDTHWFLQASSEDARVSFVERVADAMTEAGDRRVVFVAHHPYRSAGEHGGLATVGRAVGIPWLLKKSGTLVQDLNSPAFLDLKSRLRAAFGATGRVPLVWAGGHDHSLQVLKAQEDLAPRIQLVSGSASKRTEIQGGVPGVEWGASETGYMMLFLLTDGSARLFVVASDSDTALCPETPDAERRTCLDTEADLFFLRYSEELAPAISADTLASARDSTAGERSSSSFER